MVKCLLALLQLLISLYQKPAITDIFVTVGQREQAVNTTLT